MRLRTTPGDNHLKSLASGKCEFRKSIRKTIRAQNFATGWSPTAEGTKLFGVTAVVFEGMAIGAAATGVHAVSWVCAGVGSLSLMGMEWAKDTLDPMSADPVRAELCADLIRAQKMARSMVPYSDAEASPYEAGLDLIRGKIAERERQLKLAVNVGISGIASKGVDAFLNARALSLASDAHPTVQKIRGELESAWVAGLTSAKKMQFAGLISAYFDLSDSVLPPEGEQWLKDFVTNSSPSRPLGFVPMKELGTG